MKSRPELVEDGVEDERPPADEEDGCDATEEDVCSPTTLIHFRMLTGRPGNDVIIMMLFESACSLILFKVFRYLLVSI